MGESTTNCIMKTSNSELKLNAMRKIVDKYLLTTDIYFFKLLIGIGLSRFIFALVP